MMGFVGGVLLGLIAAALFFALAAGSVRIGRLMSGPKQPTGAAPAARQSLHPALRAPLLLRARPEGGSATGRADGLPRDEGLRAFGLALIPLGCAAFLLGAGLWLAHGAIGALLEQSRQHDLAAWYEAHQLWVERNWFRCFLGSVTGLAVAALIRRLSIGSARTPEATPGRWYESPTALLSLVILLLPLFAMVAPRGELPLDALQRVRTPFGEAEFARTKADLNFRLVQEPQIYFRMDRSGLSEALHMARAELHMLEGLNGSPTWTRNDENLRRLRDMRNAMRFIATVLQPMALCLVQVDDVYGDPRIIEAHVAAIGRALTQAAVFARNSVEADPIAMAAARNAIISMIDGLDAERRSHAALLDYTSGAKKSFTDNLCERRTGRWGYPRAALVAAPDGSGDYLSDDQLRRALLHPATVHNMASFFLWSGNFRAALELVRADGARSLSPDFRRYPGAIFIRGFAERWLGAQGADPQIYLGQWQQALTLIDERIDELDEHLSPVIDSCRESRLDEHVVTIQATSLPLDPSHYAEAARADRAPVSCGLANVTGDDADPEGCMARLAFGYLNYFAGKLRNHIIHETAREVLADHTRPDIDALLDNASRHASDQQAFMQAGGLARGHCHTLQRWHPSATLPGRNHVRVTTAEAERDHVLYKSSLGLLEMAWAVTEPEQDHLVTAIAFFDETIRSSALAMNDVVRQTTQRYRTQALDALDN
jgi:hypothetical protein